MKNLFKRTLTAVMVTVLIVTQSSAASISAATQKYARVITNASEVNVEEYTDSAYLGEKLQKAIEGEMPLYRDWSMKRRALTALGSTSLKNLDGYRYIAGRAGYRWMGASCFIYAVAAYYHFFDDLVVRDCDGIQEIKLSGNRRLTYENLKRWGVRNTLGAYVRLGQHSFIILKYDEETISYLDANGNGRGLVAIRTYSWNYLPSHMRHSVIAIMQPTEEKFESYFVRSKDLLILSFSENERKIIGTVENLSYDPLPVKMTISGTQDVEIPLGEIQPGETDLSELLEREDNATQLAEAISWTIGGEYIMTISCTLPNGSEHVICTQTYEVESPVQVITNPVKE